MLSRLRAAWALVPALVIGVSATSALAADLQTMLDRHVEREELDGAVLLVSGPAGRTVVASGIANRKGKVPVTENTRFYAASIGKMATAVATLQLVEEGRLALDQPIRDAVGGLPLKHLANADKALLHHLLDHTSGIPDYLSEGYVEAELEGKTRSMDTASLLAFAHGEEATNRVGKDYSYSNSNYVLLGHIVGQADGGTFPASLQRRVLDRAGMKHTTVGAGTIDATLAHGYTAEGDVSERSWFCTVGDGPLVATAGDMERFLFALFRDGGLLNEATVERMTTPTDYEEGYGLGVELSTGQWGPVYGHTGFYDGFEGEVRYYPARKTALVYLTNGNQSSEKSLPDAVAKAVLGR